MTGAAAPVTVRDVAEALGLNLATTYHLVNTLVHEGYVARSPERGLVAGPRLAARTAPGLAPAPVRRALGKAAYASGMPFERAVLEEELERVRRRGSAVVEADTEACVGAPVLDARGGVVGAVALVVTPRVLRRNEPELVATVRHAAASVSRSLASDPAAAA